MLHPTRGPRDWPNVRTTHLLLLVLLALLYTLLNAPKPLTIDDDAYYHYAAQIAKDPLDPYGFEMFWWQWPEPANHVLAPPLLPYWWSLAIRLFGQQTILWKLWLLPFSLLFVFSLYALARRFARGLEMPLVWMTVLSPTFLPSLNLMLDVPALALSLCALAVFLRACDRQSLGLAMLAGVVAGLAIETKYTGFLAPAAMLLYALLFRRFSLWLAATVGWTLLVFISWEAFMAQSYGESHFYYHYQQSGGTSLGIKIEWFALPLLALLGGVAPAVALLGLAALRRGWRTIGPAAAVVALGYIAVAWSGWSFDVPPSFSQGILALPDSEPVSVSLEQIVFTCAGILACLILAAVAWRSCWPSRRSLWEPGWLWHHRVSWFLVLWLGLEVAGYFALTPFAAVRRIMGVVVVSTLIAGHLAARTCRSPQRVALVRAIAIFSVILGLGFYGVDFWDAWTEKQAVEVAAEVREQKKQSETRARADYVGVIASAPGAGFPTNLPWAALYLSRRKPTVWYVGHWGFQHYAERAGMVPVVPDQSEFLAGDWFVKPDWCITQQVMYPPDQSKAVPYEIGFSDVLPLRTVMCYYANRGGVPLEHHEGPRVPVTIYHLKANFLARSPPPAR
jgi:hypothetical protein